MSEDYVNPGVDLISDDTAYTVTPEIDEAFDLDQAYEDLERQVRGDDLRGAEQEFAARFAEWNEALHPRDEQGQFTYTGGGTSYLSTPGDALQSLLNGESVNIAKNDVRDFIELAAAHPDHADLTKLQVDGLRIFGGNSLGLARANMPQIPSGQRDAFLAHLATHGIVSKPETVSPLDLAPVQRDISAKKVGEMLHTYDTQPGRTSPPLLISQDGHLLDGHHRWGMLATVAVDHPQLRVPVVRVMTSTQKALAHMKTYGTAHGIARKVFTASALPPQQDPRPCPPWLLDVYRMLEWDEALHPRDEQGQFTTKGGGAGGPAGAIADHQIAGDASAEARAEQLRKQKLDAARQQIALPSSAYAKLRPNGVDTRAQYKPRILGAVDAYTAERQPLHDAIGDLTFDGVKPAVGQPVAILLGGGPASGKSTITNVSKGAPAGTRPLLELPANHVTIDVDKIRQLTPEYREHVAAGDKAAAAFTHEESSDLGKALTARAARMRANIVLDGVGDGGIGGLSEKIGKLKAAGYRIEAHYVTIPTDEAVRRAEVRGRNEVGANKGRFVPERVMREQHRNVSDVVPKLVDRGQVDHLTVWDNTALGAPPIKIANAHGKALTVAHPLAWDAFVAKRHEVVPKEPKVPVVRRKRAAAAGDRLTSDQITRLLVEVVNGEPPSLRTPEADDIRADVIAQVQAIAARGGIVAIPHEWPVAP